MSDTPFVLARPTYRLTARGTTAAFSTVDPAISALNSGDADIIVGAIPFDPNESAALWAPQSVSHETVPACRSELPHCGLPVPQPSANIHRTRVSTAIARLRDDLDPLRKVVLARALSMSTTRDVDPVALLEHLVDNDPAGNGFLVNVGDNRHIVGSSPELLVSVHGDTVACHPLAGSAARSTDERADALAGQQLLASAKDQAEHAFVVDAIRDALTPLCRELHAPTTPELTSTPTMWHLGTPIQGTLVRPATALEVARALHPTPAVCGTPSDSALDYIRTHEEPRGFYAGAVGWCDRDGNGEWMIALRCADISSDHRTVRAWAGGGITADSDPDAEMAETDVKFATILRAFGIYDASAP